MLHIGLNLRIIELATNETLGVEHPESDVNKRHWISKANLHIRVVGVHRGLVLGGVADETLVLREGDIGRGRSITLVVGDDFDTVVLPHTDAAAKNGQDRKYR